MDHFTYREQKTKEISFPLGGIGTGCIGLAGNGRLVDWEIFNRPNKGSVNGFSHFAIKAEAEGKLLDARVLNGNLQPPYTGMYGNDRFGGYGFGPDRTTMAGVPHFKETAFSGEYPFATLSFCDEKFPGSITMTAFNPLIPLNEKDSSIPGAFFEIEIVNNTKERITYTLCLSLNNPKSDGTALNTYFKDANLQGLQLSTGLTDTVSPEYGDLCVATDSPEVSYQEYWYRGRWFDNLGIYWRDFTAPGKLRNRQYAEAPGQGTQDHCSLASHIDLEPGCTKRIRYVITWSFPNSHNFWSPEKCESGSCDCKPSKPKTWKNYYATLFKNSSASAAYAINNWDRLYSETLRYKEALFSSSLPPEALDAVSANISILKTPTCLRLEDGSFYGFEGCHCKEGCCEGSCTHVWNYAYALPFLFPRLERSMRNLDYRYNQREDGSMCFRLQLPLGRERWQFRACADGQFGGVIKTYRDWKISGDTEWLKSNWQAIKKSIEFAWAPTNEDRWDADMDGVLEGRQHHTLDMELYGPNAWLTGFYLAALKAGAEMAETLGDKETARQYGTLFNKGRKWVDANLFNGEYYYQQINLQDRSILEPYCEGGSLFGDSTLQAYWNDEAGEIKYQIGEGCGVDQVVAQWHADICGLGDIFENAQVNSSLKSIYHYNFKKSMVDHFNPCRLYCLNDEGGVVICDWPEGRYKPVVPAPYSEETMNGFEYQAACHMIRRGLVQEGMEIVRAIRHRYDGERRNPWNEFECGSNYARSMASYDLLLAFSGFTFNLAEGMLGFNPIRRPGETVSYFWSVDSGWGTFEACDNRIELKVLYGSLSLKKLKLPFLADKSIKTIYTENGKVEYNAEDSLLQMAQPVVIREGGSLVVEVS
jgi:non-lysosomal glucosylceramidase